MKVSAAESRAVFWGVRKREVGGKDGECELLTADQRERKVRMHLGDGLLLLLMVSYTWQQAFPQQILEQFS